MGVLSLVGALLLGAFYVRSRTLAGAALPDARARANMNALLDAHVVAVVGAHPDDLDFYAGGTAALLASRGARIHLLVCTPGGKENRWWMTPAASRKLGAVRIAEQRASGRVLGLADVTFLNHADGSLKDNAPLECEISAWLCRIRPDTVMAFDYESPWGSRAHAHPDHLAGGEATAHAISAVHPTPLLFLYGTGEPNTWVNITPVVERKWQALAAHRSQFHGWRMWLVKRLLSRWTQGEGAKVGARYAETFRLASP